MISRTAFLAFAIYASTAVAADLSGTWKFEKAGGFYSHQKNIAGPDQKVIQIINNRTNFGARCLATYKKEKYQYNGLFQLALKGGVSEKELGSFLKKEFGVSLPANGFYYHLEGPSQLCSEEFEDVLIDGNKLLVAVGGEVFYSFIRLNATVESPAAQSPELAGLTPAQLPFDIDIFANYCATQLAVRGAVPKESNKCSPVFTPYIAKKESTNYIAQLIGNHDYRKGGANFADDYAPPFAHNLHPVYNVLPPFKGIVVVRVDDLEPGKNEEREIMGGAYLSIKSGKVIDQLNERCNFTEKYTCIDEENNQKFQLLENGKFKKL